MNDRPNILWLTYEDTSPQFVSCYGQTPVVTTPNIDQLAAEGVRFDNAFAPAPVCSASRSAIITGVCNEALGLGHHRSKYPIPRDLIPGFPKYLQEVGYYTTNNVKTDYNIEDERDFIQATWNESSPKAHWRNRTGGEPFFSVFNYLDSHQSRTMTFPWGKYEEEVVNKLPEDEVVGPEGVALPPIYRDNDEMRRHLSRTYNSLRLCDRRMEERLDELRADGLMDDTIVFCFADHGEGIPRGKCNGIGFGYRAAFVIYFPDKYAHLSPWGTQVVTDELVSFEDLAPTLLSLAGVPVPEYMTGRAFLGPQRQAPPPYIFASRNRLDDTPDLCRSAMDGRFVYTRNFFPHLPVVKYQKYSDVGGFMRSIRRDYVEGKLNPVQAELVEPTRPLEYLYDLLADTWEIRNLAEDPAYADDLRRLRQATFDHMHDVHDVMFLPEREMVRRARESSPYERRADVDYNPLSEMLKAAELVGAGAEALPRQIELLSHERDVVRYWAAVGIYAAREHLEPLTEAVRAKLDDPAAFVQVELAAALCAACRDPEAKRLLEEHLLSDDELLAHQAVEKILYMPKAAPEFAETFDKLHARLAEMSDVQSSYFPLEQGVEMYRSLYQSQPLYYEWDEPYHSEEEKARATPCIL